MSHSIWKKTLINVESWQFILCLSIGWLAFLVLAFFLGARFLFPDEIPDVGSLPFTKNWGIALEKGNIKTISSDGTVTLLVTGNSLELYDSWQKLKWKNSIGENWKDIQQPIIDNSRFFYDDSKSTFAVDKNTGITIWSANHLDHIITNSRLLGIYKNRLYLELYNYGLYALDINTGKLIWKYHYSRSYADIKFSDEKIIIFLAGQILICDAGSGQIIEDLEIGISHAQTVIDGKIYYGEEIRPNYNELKTYNFGSKEFTTIYKTEEDIFCLINDDKSLYFESGLKLMKITLSGEKLWGNYSSNDNCTDLYTTDTTLLEINSQGDILSYNKFDGKLSGKTDKYHLTDPNKASIFSDGSGRLNLLLANSANVVHYIEIK